MFLKRFLSNPKAFIQRASLKYAYKTMPDFLNFRSLRGFENREYYNRFYNRFKESSVFTVPLGIPFYFMRQRPHHIALQMRNYFPVFYYTGALFVNDDGVKNIEEIEKNFFLINDGINGNSIFEVPGKILYTFWCIDHYFYVKDDKTSFVIYDYLDEIDISPRFNEDTVKKHNFMLKRADLILASSQNLYDKIPAEYKSKSLLITNGVDVNHFQREYRYNKEKKVYTVGFYGALEKWIDIVLIEKIASQKEFSVKLIGPVIDTEFNRLKSHPDIEFLGHKPYEELPKLVEDIDIFLLPFKINELTKSVSPVKLYEHFATGKPVVSTALPECQKYDTVFIATHDDILKKLKSAVLAIGDEAYTEKSKRYAKENSWEDKVKIVVDEIKKKLDKC